MLFSKNFDILVEIGELSVLGDKPDICQFWYITSLFRLVKNTSKLRKIAKKICIFYAKKYTSSKKVHHRRLCGCDLYQLCMEKKKKLRRKMGKSFAMEKIDLRRRKRRRRKKREIFGRSDNKQKDVVKIELKFWTKNSQLGKKI